MTACVELHTIPTEEYANLLSDTDFVEHTREHTRARVLGSCNDIRGRLVLELVIFALVSISLRNIK